METVGGSTYTTCYCTKLTEHIKGLALKSQSHLESSSHKHSLQRQNSLRSNLTRASSLFMVGVFFAIILNLAQKQNNITDFGPGVFGEKLNSAWWIPPLFGLASIFAGYIYPTLDEMYGTTQKFTLDWPSVMKCIAVFVGINHASAKINFDSELHLMMVLAVMSIALWYWFDSSSYGLGVGLCMACLATIVTQLLVASGVFMYSKPDFIYIRSWVPWLYFSGGVTVGTIGRALAVDVDDLIIKPHID